MSLSSIQLDAFLAVCRTQNFTRAAEDLHVTQSALSQRIKNLEDELGSTLFTRDPQGAKPTDLGQRLLRYCQAKEGLEAEFVESLKSSRSGELRGPLRVAGFSTVTRSLVLPALKPLLLKHESIQLELKTADLSELPELLTSGRTDFVLVNEPIRRQGVTNFLLGHERNVVVQSRASRPHVFLDHDESDSTTLDFFKHHDRKLPKGFRRLYVGDIDAILEGVQMGLGRAIAPQHLLTRGIEVAKGLGEMLVPVHLAYFEQPFYTELHKAAREALEQNLTAALKN
jgi:DNA-binding transcriptional LysR family regulator